MAQSQAEGNSHLAQWECRGRIFKVHDRGRHPFAYILHDPWFRIELSSLTASSAPLAHCKLASQALTFEGPKSVESELRQIIEALGIPEDEARVSRADLCVDFVTDCDIGNLSESDWVTRARTMSQHSVKRQFSGWSIGQGGDISCRLYNKTLEIQTSEKTYMYDIWSDLGWDGKQTVWRLEFQYRREALRGFDIKSFTQFMEQMGGLWRYSSENWLRLTIPSDSDTTQSRWPLHPMWETLSQADWGVESGVSRRSPPQRVGPSDRYLFLNGLSPLTSFMAREQLTDIKAGIDEFYSRARDFHLERAHNRDEHPFREYISGYDDFDGYVHEKVAQKAREYSSMKNNEVAGIKDPGDEAVAEEYRKRSDG